MRVRCCFSADVMPLLLLLLIAARRKRKTSTHEQGLRIDTGGDTGGIGIDEYSGALGAKDSPTNVTTEKHVKSEVYVRHQQAQLQCARARTNEKNMWKLLISHTWSASVHSLDKAMHEFREYVHDLTSLPDGAKLIVVQDFMHMAQDPLSLKPENLILSMQKVLRAVDGLVLVLTEPYLNSAWCLWEWCVAEKEAHLTVYPRNVDILMVAIKNVPVSDFVCDMLAKTYAETNHLHYKLLVENLLPTFLPTKSQQQEPWCTAINYMHNILVTAIKKYTLRQSDNYSIARNAALKCRVRHARKRNTYTAPYKPCTMSQPLETDRETDRHRSCPPSVITMRAAVARATLTT